MTETVLLRLPLTQRLPLLSTTAPNGFICGSPAAGVGPSGMLNARSGSPPGIFVTVSFPQLATQMLPWRSETVPCGQDILPCVYPSDGEIGAPSGRKVETLLCGDAWGSKS